MDLSGLGRFLIFLGAVLFFGGVFFILAAKITFLGRLPGDIIIKKENFTFYFPLVTMILLSIILTIIMNIFFNK